MRDVAATLKEREGRYGDYHSGTAVVSQALKDVMRRSPNWHSGLLTCAQRESLDMIANKISRILSGDPDYADSWHDIAGYAKLNERPLLGESL
jgi:hypothetical protein